MKQFILLFAMVLTFGLQESRAQFFNKIKDTVKETISGDGDASDLTEGEVGNGLKAALQRGVELGVDQLAKPDGYFKDLDVKILLPEEARKVEDKLRMIGLDKQVDDAIESLNRAAEDAVVGAKDIFIDAIKAMTIQDAMSLLRGEENAATNYLDKNTRTALAEKFKPTIKESLDKVDATKHWNFVFSKYNSLPFVKDINPDLDDYVTQKAIDGLFVQIAKQEKEIRENPGARVTDLLKKVFGN